MAYDKAVTFCYKNNLEDKQTTNYRIDSCEWGWLVEDSELVKKVIGGEIDYHAILTPLEAIKRYEKQKDKIEEIKISQLKLFQECYEKSKKLFDFSFYNKKKHDFDRYQSYMYDRRLVNITFEKFFWESGMN